MNNIKFRCWDLLLKKFIDLKSNPHLYSAILDNELQGYVLQRFTGLKDKNNKEIYEGDICQEIWNALVGQMESKYIIKFGEYQDAEGFMNIGFYVDYTLNKNPQNIQNGGNLSNKSKNREIIGNNFENIDLLK